MSKPKPKYKDIFWLDSDSYNKALFQLRTSISNTLDKNYSLYGMDAFHLGATNSIIKACEDFALRVRGVDKPIFREG